MRRDSSRRRSATAMAKILACGVASRNSLAVGFVPLPKVARGSELPPLHVKQDQRVFVLTGAGMRAESGVRTFRDAGGLWEEHRIEDVATPEAFARDPELVWHFYSQRRKQAGSVQPNPAHLALAKLQAQIGERLFLCTQNVDPLHERAGSRDVHHMHGELLKTRCDSCERLPFHDDGAYLDEVPRCDRCGGRLRPPGGWFGEIPLGVGPSYPQLNAGR